MIKCLDRISQEELEAIRRNNRTKSAQLVWHPYYFGKNRRFDRFVRKQANGEIPLIIGQPWNKLGELREQLAKLGITESHSIFIVPTKATKRNPFGEIVPDWPAKFIYYGKPTKGWQRLIGRLKAIGAEKVTVDGRVPGKYTPGQIYDRTMPYIDWDAELKKMEKEGKKPKVNKGARSLFRTARQRGWTWGNCPGVTWSRLRESGQFKSVRYARRFK